MKLREQQGSGNFDAAIARLVQVALEKIRTYNYKDNRVTDHRLSKNCSLNPVLEGDLEPWSGLYLSRPAGTLGGAFWNWSIETEFGTAAPRPCAEEDRKGDPRPL